MPAFARAYRAGLASIVDSINPSQFRQIWETSQSAQDVLDRLDILRDDSEDQTWSDIADKMADAYERVVQESGEHEAKEINDKLGTRFGFTAKAPVEGEIVEKKAKPKPKLRAKPQERESTSARAFTEAGTRRLTGLVVPVNTYSQQWMKQRSLELVKQGMRKGQREVVGRVLSESFDRGLRAESVYSEIKANIGLTDRDYDAVLNRRELLSAQGYNKDEIEAAVDKYRDKLLGQRAERIARTETSYAQAAGRRDMWRSVTEGGYAAGVERVWVSAPETSNKGAPCNGCLALDGATASVDGMYDSVEYGMIEGPPAHPNCMCTETLQRIEPTAQAEQTATEEE